MKKFNEFLNTDFLKEEFELRRNELIENNSKHSNPEIIKDSITFGNITKMGKKIIPFILEELETKKNTIIWNLILQKITNVNPIKEESNFNMNLIADDWICWCKNYLKNVDK
jgi:hypothetical protein